MSDHAYADEGFSRIPIVRIANVQPTSAQLCIHTTLGGSSGGAAPLVAKGRAAAGDGRLASSAMRVAAQELPTAASGCQSRPRDLLGGAFAAAR